MLPVTVNHSPIVFTHVKLQLLIGV